MSRSDDTYRYISEAYGGYHFGDPHRGVNIQAGIFMSYIGLWSYYNFDNWTYQLEPWLVTGWQSYAKFNSLPGIGGQVRYAPRPRSASASRSSSRAA